MANCLTLKKSNCKNCYKCIRHCPVKSIRFSGNQAYIIGNECILCGQCFVVCPQNAKQIVDETEKVRVLLQGEAPVYVSIAPSFVANYEGAGINSMRAALMQLGFAGAEETALGATIVKREYERMIAEDNRDVIISSCCHSVNLLVQKYFPRQLEYLADVFSPMQAHCADIKRRIPGAKTVFIGPCVAKKDEAEYYEGIVDAVLTFDELTNWLKSENIELKNEEEFDDNSRARFFPTTGGILKTMATDFSGYTYMAIDGVENCIAALEDIRSGKIHKCFIEMSAWKTASPHCATSKAAKSTSALLKCRRAPAAASAGPLWKNSTARRSRTMLRLRISPAKRTLTFRSPTAFRCGKPSL